MVGLEDARGWIAAANVSRPSCMSDSARSAPLYYSHPACLEHDPRAHIPGHPDIPERLLAIERALEDAGWLG